MLLGFMWEHLGTISFSLSLKCLALHIQLSNCWVPSELNLGKPAFTSGLPQTSLIITFTLCIPRVS